MEVFNSETGIRAQLHGDVWIRQGENLTREQILENPDKKFKNLIVDVCSKLIAEWAITGNPGFPRSSTTDYPGILSLAVGTGAIGWDLQNPPVETAGQQQMFSESERKAFTTVNYTDGLGNVSPTAATNVIDFLTTFTETQAIGPIVEMGLFGGNNSLEPNGVTMVNYKTFAVINKSATSSLSILWRLTF